MPTFANTSKATPQNESAKVAEVDRAHGQSSEVNSMLHLQRTAGNQAVLRRLKEDAGNVRSNSTGVGPIGLDHNFSSNSISPQVATKAVESEQPGLGAAPVEKAEEVESGRRSIIIQTDDTGVPKPAPTPKPAPAPTPAPAAPAAKKTAGVDSFTVKWAKNSVAGPTIAKLRLDSTAKFTKDATHDPAVAEFRQNAASDFKITDGPNKGFKDKTNLQDDHYSRADDTGGHKLSDVDFATNDNPGSSESTPIDKDDVVDYTFTAEQMIIDTSDSDKVIAKRGPHTGTIKGKHPRTFGGVPSTLS